ncbi:MAG: AI-2E family transporter [Candidatus Doudnabacteria bacterium]|nr:AI-2E family transporter [Candidatus Doudnabacteria bacterium]
MTANPPQKVLVQISTMAIVKVVAAGLLLVGLFIIRDVLLTLLVAIVIASAIDPLVDWLYRKARFPRGLTVVLVYLIVIGVVATIVYFMVPPIVIQFQELSGRLGEFREELAGGRTSFTRLLNQLGITNVVSTVRDYFGSFAGNVFRTTLGVFSGVADLIAILVISFYLVSSESGMKNLVRSLVPFKHQAYAVRLTDKVQNKIGHWLLGQLILSFSIFLPTYIGLSILGVKFALALALLAGLLEIVPYLGPVLSALPALFIAVVQYPPLALFVLLLYIIIQQVENYVLVPKIMGRTVGANPVVILLAVLIGFKLAGILGMLLAVPIVAALQVFFSDFIETREQRAREI